MQNVTNEVCPLLRRIFTVVANLSEMALEMSQQPRRINIIKLQGLRVFFFAKRLKNDACSKFCGVVTFELFLLKYLGCFVK